jgi:hypothetical protein
VTTTDETGQRYAEVTKFPEMLGVSFVEVTGGEPGSETMDFRDASGRIFRFFHSQDCCESVGIADIVGDVSDLIGFPMLEAEEISSGDAPAPEHAESYTWTFYRFSTVKGTVTVRWLGESNGYYGEGVSFLRIDTPKAQ